MGQEHRAGVAAVAAAVTGHVIRRDVATVDSPSEWRRLTNIKTPMMKPGLAIHILTISRKLGFLSCPEIIHAA